MKREKLFIRIILLAIGSFGIGTTLMLENAIPARAIEAFDSSIPFISGVTLVKIMPFIILFTGVNLGAYTYDKASIRLPLFEAFAKGKIIYKSPAFLLLAGLVGGLISGILMYVIIQLFYLYDSQELVLLKEVIPSFKNRLFFRAFTEEVIIRFGLLSTLAWIFSLFFKQKTNYIYLFAILVSATFFAYLQAYIYIEKIFEITSPTIFLFFFISKLTTGIIYGWFYWKYGLGVSITAHALMGLLLILFV